MNYHWLKRVLERIDAGDAYRIVSENGYEYEDDEIGYAIRQGEYIIVPRDRAKSILKDLEGLVP